VRQTRKRETEPVFIDLSTRLRTRGGESVGHIQMIIGSKGGVRNEPKDICQTKSPGASQKETRWRRKRRGLNDRHRAAQVKERKQNWRGKRELACHGRSNSNDRKQKQGERRNGRFLHSPKISEVGQTGGRWRRGGGLREFAQQARGRGTSQKVQSWWDPYNRVKKTSFFGRNFY